MTDPLTSLPSSAPEELSSAEVSPAAWVSLVSAVVVAVSWDAPQPAIASAAIAAVRTANFLFMFSSSFAYFSRKAQINNVCVQIVDGVEDFSSL